MHSLTCTCFLQWNSYHKKWMLTLFENIKTLHHEPLISVWKNQLSVLYLVQQRRFLHFPWWDFSPEPVACKINTLRISVIIHEALTCSEELVKKCQCITDLVEIWKCWFLRWGENWSTREKPLGAREIRTNNKINPHMVSTQQFNMGHIGGRWVLSPLCHSLLPKIN